MILAFAAVRWLHYASLMAVFGTAALAALLGAAGWRGQRMAALLAVASALAWFGFAAAQMAGDPAAMLDPAVLGLAARSTLFGQVFLARLALLILTGIALARGWPQRLVALLSGMALALIAVTGHAAGASPAHFAAIGITSDALHLLTAGFWIGGLVMLAALAGRRATPFAGTVAVFAQWGMIAVTLLILTGMLNAAMILLGGPGRDTADYLIVLGAKLVLVAAMLALALSNHFRLLPKLAQEGPARLFANIRWELGLGAGVLALAALLGLLSPTL